MVATAPMFLCPRRILIIRPVSPACPTRCDRSFVFFTFVPFKLPRGPIQQTEDRRAVAVFVGQLDKVDERCKNRFTRFRGHHGLYS